MKRIEISSDLALPLDWMTLATVVYGARGSGKTSLGRVMAEEVTKAKQRFCAIDLKGDWYGLKSSVSGSSAGIPVIVFGGDHQDLPLDDGAGAFVGETVAEIDQSCIIDLEHFSKGRQIRFLAEFFARLYDKNRDPLLLLLDEAQRYAPQSGGRGVDPEMSKCLGAVEDLVKLGRKHGIGPVLFTQRGSGLNKEVSELCDLLVAFRTPGPLDQERIKDWFDANTPKAQRDEVMGRLSGLDTGTAVFASGHPDLKLFGVHAVRRPDTFDSSATPKVGQRRAEPKKLAAPDLDAIREKMSATIERAKENDPRELKKQLTEAKREIAKLQQREPAATKTETKVVTKFVLKDADIARIEKFAERGAKMSADINAAVAVLQAAIAQTRTQVMIPLTRTQPVATKMIMPRAEPMPSRVVATDGLSSLQQRLLNGLAWLESIGISPASREQVAFMAAVRPTTGHFKNELGGLRSAGLATYPTDGMVALTDAGRTRASLDGVPQNAIDLQRQVRSMVSALQARILDYLIERYPSAASRADIAAAAGVSETTGHFKNELGGLRTLGVVDYPQQGFAVAKPVLFLEAK